MWASRSSLEHDPGRTGLPSTMDVFPDDWWRDGARASQLRQARRRRITSVVIIFCLIVGAAGLGLAFCPRPEKPSATAAAGSAATPVAAQDRPLTRSASWLGGGQPVPVAFQPNVGLDRADVQFTARGSGYSLALL